VTKFRAFLLLIIVAIASLLTLFLVKKTEPLAKKNEIICEEERELDYVRVRMEQTFLHIPLKYEARIYNNNKKRVIDSNNGVTRIKYCSPETGNAIQSDHLYFNTKKLEKIINGEGVSFPNNLHTFQIFDSDSRKAVKKDDPFYTPKYGGISVTCVNNRNVPAANYESCLIRRNIPNTDITVRFSVETKSENSAGEPNALNTFHPKETWPNMVEQVDAFILSMVAEN